MKLGSGGWSSSHVQPPAKEEDPDAVIGEAAEAPGGAFQGLDLAVKPLAHRIGDAMDKVTQQSR